MARSTGSRVPFFDAQSGRPIEVLNHAVVWRTSAPWRWSGVHVEIASHAGWVVDDVHVDGYYVAVNLDREPLVIEHKGVGGFHKAIAAPGTLVVHPVGECFSFRVAQGARWGGVLLTPDFVESTLGRRFGMPASFGTEDPQSLAIVNALVEETRQGAPTGALYAEHLGAALALRLGVCHGSGPGPTPRRAGCRVPSRRLQRVVDYIAAHLDQPLSLAELAAVAGLSRFHFAREFKQATGRPPHRFVLELRLEAARRMLRESSHSVGDVSLRCGFADPSHLVRAFRRRFGVTPGHWRTQTR